MSNSPSKAEVPAKVDRPEIKAGGKLAAFVPQDLEQAWRLSVAFAEQSGDMVPQAYRGKPGAVFLAISKGAELGLSPLAAMQHIAPINGRATLWGDALPGLVRRSGHRIKEWMEGQGEQMVAYCTVTRSDGEEITRSFSVAQATKARLWGKAGPWSEYPERMLQMRARSWACRDGAADALLGLAVREEVEDYRGPDNAKDITPTEPGKNHILATIEEAGEDEREAPADASAEPEEAKPELTPEQEAEIMEKISRQHEAALTESAGEDGEEDGEAKSPALFP